jgi:hypothetical protein
LQITKPKETTMIISDLHYLEVMNETNSVVGGFITDYGSVNFYENFNLYKDIKVKVDIKGNTATAEADSDAYGKNTVTQSFTKTTVAQGYGSSSQSTSIASTAGASHHW